MFSELNIGIRNKRRRMLETFWYRSSAADTGQCCAHAAGSLKRTGPTSHPNQLSVSAETKNHSQLPNPQSFPTEHKVHQIWKKKTNENLELGRVSIHYNLPVEQPVWFNVVRTRQESEKCPPNYAIFQVQDCWYLQKLKTTSNPPNYSLAPNKTKAQKL
jgi:hypothetical protein